jgi:hypothetical protein
MIQTFTLNDVVRYLYDEMSHEEADRLHEALMFDDELMDSYQQMLSAKQILEHNPVQKSPSRQTVDKILAYSRSYDVLLEEN